MSANLTFLASDAGREPSRPTPGLAGELGAEMALTLSQALAQLDQLLPDGKHIEPGLNGLRGAIERARRIAMLGQQISHLASGRVTPMAESLDLPAMWRQVLRERKSELALGGIEIRQRLRPAPVAADPSVLHTLLDGLLAWALEHCTVALLHLSTEMETWPVRARLLCDFGWQAPAGAVDPLDTLSWRLVQQAAALLGAQCGRKVTADRVRLTVTFPEATRSWPQLVVERPVYVGAAEPSAFSLEDRVVLLLTPREALRRVARAALEPLGAVLHEAGTVGEARLKARQFPADVLVADTLVPGVDALCGEWRAGSSGPALLWVGDEPPGVHLSTTSDSCSARLGIDSLAGDLPRALRFLLR
jgi:hypothetical protein